LYQNARILVIDDEENVRRAMTALLEREGYLVHTAENGKEAIEKSNANFYNAALIDFRLPDIEGTELLTLLKETVPKMIKIVVTGYPSLQNAAASVNKGADAFLMKPINVETLLSMLRERLHKQREDDTYSEEKVRAFIETRIKKTGGKAFIEKRVRNIEEKGPA
jgi:DNA-binding NtrC family response regulator